MNEKNLKYKPCLLCSCSDNQFSCSLYGKQGHECPLYKHWLNKFGLKTYFKKEIIFKPNYLLNQNV